MNGNGGSGFSLSPNIVFLNILRLLFNGAVKYSNTKPQPLINGGTVICSDEMHRFLQSIHFSLQIRQWIEHQKSVEHKTKLLITKIRSQLNKITTQQLNDQSTVQIESIIIIMIIIRIIYTIWM